MFWWLPKNRRKVLAEADEYLESFGNLAYSEAKKAERVAWAQSDKKLGKFLWRARMEIAKQTNFSPGMDTATRYLERPLPVTKPKDTTLH